MRYLLFIVLMLVSLPAQAQDAAWNRILKTNVIRCGYQPWPPYVIKDPNSGAISGVMPELTESIAKEAGFSVEWTEEAGNSSSLEGLQTGRYDVLCSPFTETPSRARTALFSDPVVYVPFNMYVRADDDRFDGNQNAANDPNVTFISSDGDLSAIIIKNRFPDAKVTMVPDMSDGAQMLEHVATKKGDIVITDAAIAAKYMQNNPGKIKQAGDAIEAPNVVFALPIGEHNLKAFMDVSVRSMQATGITEKILKKYEEFPGMFLHVSRPYEFK